MVYSSKVPYVCVALGDCKASGRVQLPLITSRILVRSWRISEKLYHTFTIGDGTYLTLSPDIFISRYLTAVKWP